MTSQEEKQASVHGLGCHLAWFCVNTSESRFFFKSILRSETKVTIVSARRFDLFLFPKQEGLIMAAKGAVFIENWSSRVKVLFSLSPKRHKYLLKCCQAVLAVSFSWCCSLKKIPPWLQQRSLSGHSSAGSESSPFLLLCPQPCAECGTSSKQLKMSFQHEQLLQLVEFQFGTCGNLGRGGWKGSVVVFPSNKLFLSTNEERKI